MKKIICLTLADTQICCSFKVHSLCMRFCFPKELVGFAPQHLTLVLHQKMYPSLEV